ncbi:esterase [Paucibacter sp. TC2R-5]|uniref:esterase n=1 Tax=Paucibacter sp. TC2R-5 TaxID=2893555 RepID=UPI0021E514BA|nr:esterase [Paucibacter sp. TC2R-5]MCV2360666.1 esterase [Paucibacter sp. TC2R-5]
MNKPPAPFASRAVAMLPDKGVPDLLFLLLHGAGADAAQMRPLAQALRAQYPQAAVLALNAPQAAEGGQHWYPLDGCNDDNHGERVQAALPAFIATVRSWAAQWDLPWQHVALGGFSQGAVLALEAAQAEAQLVGRVLAFSGAYATPPVHAPHEVSLHILHGQLDGVLPYQDQVSAARRLVQLGADITADVLPDIGHELHPELIERAMEQLRTFLPARMWKEAMQAAAEQDGAGKK